MSATKLEPIGNVMLPVTSDREVDAKGELTGKSVLWLRFAMFQASGEDVAFDVCNSGTSIVVTATIPGYKPQYMAIELEAVLPQLAKIAHQRKEKA